MIDLENIHPLTDFKRNVKQFIERTKATKSPLVLTVNGKAEIVVQDAISFQEMTHRLKQRDINLGAEQLRNGQYTEYNDETLPGLLEKIKERGERRLHSKKD
jgi:prevent-host-death family protein